MAILDYEHWNRETAITLPGWFTLTNGTVSADNQGPFGYGRHWSHNTVSFHLSRSNSFADVTELWTNFHLFLPALPATNIHIFSLLQGSGLQCSLGISPSGQLLVFRTDVTLVHTFPAPVAIAGGWMFVQVRFLVDAAVGVCEAWLNGAHVGTATGLNIRGQTTNPVNGWRLSGTLVVARIANLILYSLTGTAPTARTPETRIYAALPNAAGAASQWTRSSGSANWEMVDEQPNDGDTTFNSAGNTGLPLDDLYACPSDIPAGAVVYAVASELVSRKDDAGDNHVSPLVRSGAVTSAGAVTALTTVYQRIRSIWHNNPDGSVPWTVGAANAAQVGIRRSL